MIYIFLKWHSNNLTKPACYWSDRLGYIKIILLLSVLAFVLALPVLSIVGAFIYWLIVINLFVLTTAFCNFYIKESVTTHDL